MLDMQVEFLATYLWKEEGAEAKDAEKGRSARGETPGECEVLEAVEKASHRAWCWDC